MPRCLRPRLRLIAAVALCVGAAAPAPAQPDRPAADAWARPAQPIALVTRDVGAEGDAEPGARADSVLIAGRVSAGTGLIRADRTEIYLQDGTGGMRIVLPPDAPEIFTGDSLIARGAVRFRAGMAEMAAPAFRVVEAPPADVPHRKLDLRHDTLERHESELVEITGTVVQGDSTEVGWMLVLLSSDQLVQVFAYHDRLGEPIPLGRMFEKGDHVRARGVAVQHDPVPPHTGNYLVLPRAAADVRRAGLSPTFFRWAAVGVAGLLGLALLWSVALRRQVRRRAAELSDSETRYGHLFDAAGDVVIVHDADSHAMLEANRAAQLAFGVDAEGERTGGAVALADLAEDRDEARRHVAEASRRGQALDVLELVTMAGTVPYEVSTRRLSLPSGAVLVSVARDVAARRTYEHGILSAMQEAERAREEAEEAARLKAAILANMSHEIRTPLTAIIGFADILAEEVPPDLVDHIEAIQTGGTRLLDTLNSVLDLARLDADQAELTPEPLDAVEEVRSSARLLAPLAQRKGLVLRVETDAPTLPVRQSRSALDRVVTNLVGNAIKFTSAGDVRVSIHSADTYFAVRVKDSGVGIAQEFLPALFEPFKQESQGHGRSHEGTGLGLAITKKLVERMGGEIRVWSQKGEGSLFEVALPRVGPGVKADAPSPALPPMAAPPVEAAVTF